MAYPRGGFTILKGGLAFAITRRPPAAGTQSALCCTLLVLPRLLPAPSASHHHNLMPNLAPSFVAIRHVRFSIALPHCCRAFRPIQLRLCPRETESGNPTGREKDVYFKPATQRRHEKPHAQPPHEHVNSHEEFMTTYPRSYRAHLRLALLKSLIFGAVTVPCDLSVPEPDSVHAVGTFRHRVNVKAIISHGPQLTPPHRLAGHSGA